MGKQTTFQGYLTAGHRKPWLAAYDDCVPASLQYPESTCHRLLEEAARNFPNQPCAIYKGKTLTFSEINQIVDRLAAGLHLKGLKQGDRVGLLLPNIPQFVYSFFAILKAGGVVVAMNPQSTGPEIALQANETQMTMVIALNTIYPAIKDLQAQTDIRIVLSTTLDDALLPAEVLLMQDEAIKDKGVIEELPQADAYLIDMISTEPIDLPPGTADGPAIFQYTGGTTGVSKAAVGLHRNLTANTFQFRSWLWNMEDGKEIILAAIPMFHVYGMVLCLNLAMAMGAALLLVPSSRNLDELISEIATYKPTIFPGVPGLYRGLVNHPGLSEGSRKLDSLKICISGSAPLLPEVKRQFERLISGRLVEGYGLSEAPTATHCNPVAGLNVAGSIGLPLPDVDCVILSLEDGISEMPPGEPGELILHGPQVMMGYYHNPEETSISLQNGWLFTGDIARMDSNGYFYILDRKKDLIKVNGLQVWPHEIEEVLSLHPVVMDVGVAGIPDDARGESVKAWLVLKPGTDLQLDEVIEWCGRSLSRYKIPTEIEIVTALPRSPIGKLLRRELRKSSS